MLHDGEPNVFEEFTPREREVQELLRLGLTDGEMAGRLDVSTSAIEKHVSQIIGKLGVRNRYEAATWPERPPWWTTALAPMALFWRKASPVLPVKASSVAMAVSGGLFAAALGGLGLMAFLLPGGEGEAGASLVGTETPATVSDPLSAPAPGGSSAMAVDCAAAVAGIQSECAYPAGATFDVEIHVTRVPEEGYFGFQTKLRWEAAVASYLPSEDPAEEALWPECDVPSRGDNQQQGDPSLLFGCVPLPALSEGWTATGVVVQLRLQCQQEGSTPLVLVARQGDPQGGTVFLNRTLAPIDPVLTSAQVTCGSPPPCPPEECGTPGPPGTPGPSTTPLPAPTPMPTATPQATPPPLPTATPVPTPLPQYPGGRMAVDCDAGRAGIQSSCVYAGDSTFHIQIHVTQPPTDGYFGFQTKLRWNDAQLGYLPASSAEEALWRECDFPARVDNQAREPSMAFGCVSHPTLTEGDTTTGAVLQFRFQCEGGGMTPVDLVSSDGDDQGGTLFLVEDANPVYPLLAGARVVCGGQAAEPCAPDCPAPSPTPTATRLPPLVDSGSMAVDCDAATAGIQNSCQYASGATFSLQVHVTQPPTGGYFLFQTKLGWSDGQLDYLPANELADSGLWHRCDIALGGELFGEAAVGFGCAPFPELSEGDTTTGAIVEFQFQCQQDGLTNLTLIPAPGDPHGGTFFISGFQQIIEPTLTQATIRCG